jgi:hypothetical protein
MTVAKVDPKVEEAIAILTEGKSDAEKFSLAAMIRDSHQAFGKLVDNARVAAPLPAHTKRIQFLAQAIANIGLCLVDIANALNKGHDEGGKLGGVMIGLDRAICYLDEKPYEERDYVKACRERLIAELEQAKAKEPLDGSA